MPEKKKKKPTKAYTPKSQIKKGDSLPVLYPTGYRPEKGGK